MENAVALFGSFDENIKEIEKAYGVGILCRGTQIKISGDPEKVSLAGRAVQSLLALITHHAFNSRQRTFFSHFLFLVKSF